MDEAGDLRFHRVPSLAIPPVPVARHVLSGYRFLVDLVEGVGAEARWSSEPESVVLELGGCQYPVECWEELCILAELHLSGDYDFLPGRPAVLVDVGANVGFTSIFLASTIPDLLVESFEPVGINYEKARRHIDRNAHIKSRVTLHNAGLYTSDGVALMRSEPGHRGCSRVLESGEDVPAGMDRAQAVMLRAHDVLRSMRAKYEGRFVFVKMDCEGSEYHILRQLEEEGGLRVADGYLMEWHRGCGVDDNPDALRSMFAREGFHVLTRCRVDRRAATGMLLALKGP